MLKENALITNFQPHFHLRKAMRVEATSRTAARSSASVGNFNFNWMTNYIYDDDATPGSKGTVIQVSVALQHEEQPVQPRSRAVGWVTAIARLMRWPTPG